MPWQRKQKAACLREDGYTYRQIGDLFGVSVARASKLAEEGRRIPVPDETVLPAGLRSETPVEFLPVSKPMRAALTELRIDSYGKLQAADFAKLTRFLLRYPNIGRKQVEELEQLVKTAVR